MRRLALPFFVVFFLVLALVYVCVSNGATPVITETLAWTAPKTNTDGTGIVGALTYNVYQGAKGSATKTRVATAIADGSFKVPNLLAGACFQVAAIEAGQQGPLSDEVCAPLIPSGPTSVVITINIQAH